MKKIKTLKKVCASYIHIYQAKYIYIFPENQFLGLKNGGPTSYTHPPPHTHIHTTITTAAATAIIISIITKSVFPLWPQKDI